MMSIEEIREIAAQRRRVHKSGDGGKPCLSDLDMIDYIGVFGEVRFAEKYGFDVSEIRADLVEGDPGWDFRSSIGTIDIKTYRKPYNLIIPTDSKNFANIIILAKFDEFRQEVSFIGWETGSNLRAAPAKDFGYGRLSHYIPANRLRSMSSLEKMLEEARSQTQDEFEEDMKESMEYLAEEAERMWDLFED